MNRYRYSGAVLRFDQCVAQNWMGETVAPTEGRARSNFIFRFKKENGYQPHTKISLPGKIEIVNKGA